MPDSLPVSLIRLHLPLWSTPSARSRSEASLWVQAKREMISPMTDTLSASFDFGLTEIKKRIH
jgi:hypothetical protein